MPSAPSPKSEPPPREKRGGLDIRDRRQWKTWQLATVALVTLLVGMAIGHTGGGTGSAGNKATFALPAAAGSTGTATSSTNATASPGNATSGPGTGTVLLPRMQSNGPGSTASFSVAAAGWTIAWIFDCSSTAAGSAPFQIFIVPAGGATPSVDEAARTASGVSTQTVLGVQSLRIDTDPGCAWAVKVTGVGRAGPA